MTKKFPDWKPQNSTVRKISSMDKKIAFKAFRSSCSGFISRKDVRQIILTNHNSICVNCGSTDNLQIDHVKSVWFCFRNNLINQANSENNLQLLCSKCNAGKKP